MNKIAIELIFRRKISVTFQDGSRRQNFNVDSALRITEGLQSIKVEVGPEDPARDLFDNFVARSKGSVEETQDGLRVTFEEGFDLVEPEPLFLDNISLPLQGVSEEPVFCEEPLIPSKDSEPKLFGRGRPYIILGPKDIFTDANCAYTFISSSSFEPLPEKFNNRLTLTFISGSPEGQIKSLFRDYRRYGISIADKLTAFLEEVEKSLHPTFVKYLNQYRAGQLPHEVETFCGSSLDTTYFKFWVLLKVLEAQLPI